MKPTRLPQLTAHERRALAVAACVCERTLRRFLSGQPIRSTTQARIEGALRRLRLLDRGETAGDART